MYISNIELFISEISHVQMFYLILEEKGGAEKVQNPSVLRTSPLEGRITLRSSLRSHISFMLRQAHEDPTGPLKQKTTLPKQDGLLLTSNLSKTGETSQM